MKLIQIIEHNTIIFNHPVLTVPSPPPKKYNKKTNHLVEMERTRNVPRGNAVG